MVVIGLITLAAAACVLFVLRRPRAAGAPASSGPVPGQVFGQFPILALDARWGLLGNVRLRHTSATSITIDTDGLNFQAMGPRHLAFAAMENVELAGKWNGPAIVFTGREWGHRLTLTVAGDDVAAAILRALPDTVPLSPKALALRYA